MIAVEIPSRKILPRRAVLREVGQEGFKFTGLFTDDLSGCFFDIIVLRIVDIDFDLGQGIEDFLARVVDEVRQEPSSCLTAMFIALSVLARIISMTASAWVKSTRPFKRPAW